ncbi:TraB/GumN family protein [Mangrovimonas sp. DI 80]|uniref:TraB/GumN family protein n=1 Tax=Mangrovimonas sp. DI 80 TaxID=1779330 RepID=UPI0009778F1B|nr:TraB/GumN family protein [Mangrovimonas sp. DI 80]OMP29766.1 TraB/GumN family protein [Mangrovimonas sp. DI 80]
MSLTSFSRTILNTAIVLISTITIAQETNNSLLWKISGNDLEAPSYIFGTIHITCNASLDQTVKTALDNTSLLVLEIDMDHPEIQSKMMQEMYMKDGKTIKDYVSEADYQLLSDFIKTQTGMPLDLLGNIKPFFLSAMLYPKLLGCPIQSFENELMAVTKDQKEDVEGLESIEQQMQLFDEIPYEDQIQELLKSAKDNMASDRANITEMMSLYENKDLDGLYNLLLVDDSTLTAKYQNKMLDERNKTWIAKIGSFSKEQPTFFGVGAGHLSGDNGVISLLRKAGYTVEAVLP